VHKKQKQRLELELTFSRATSKNRELVKEELEANIVMNARAVNRT